MLDPPDHDDVNATVAGYLRDLAYAQASPPQMYGYKRAAAAIHSLDTPLTTLIEAEGSLPRIRGIGPASTRVIQEVLETGTSSTVERAIDESGGRADIERRRGLRRHFLSRAKVVQVLSDPDLAGPRLADYRGDLQMHSEWSDGQATLAESGSYGAPTDDSDAPAGQTASRRSGHHPHAPTKSDRPSPVLSVPHRRRGDR